MNGPVHCDDSAPEGARAADASTFVPNLDVTLELSSPSIETGQNGQGIVVLRNTGLAAIDFESVSPLLGVVLDHATREITGSIADLTAREMLKVSLAYKEVLEIPVVFSTGRSGENDATLPPGQYLVGVQIPVQDLSSNTSRGPRAIEVPLAEVTLVAP
ncbi:MAG: hypothetical protein ACRDVC_05975 [Acidimicrobiales bacterium]